MSKQINSEDQRKLHAELNQIINQRFILTTTAITVFGAFSAVMTPKTPIQSPVEVGHLLIGGTVYVLIFYLLLLAWNRMLLSLQETISTYLELTGSSQWEAHFRKFVLLKPVGLRVQGWAFLALGFLSTSWPFLIARSLGIPLEWRWILFLLIVATAYFLATYLLGFKHRKHEQIRSIWETILGQEKDADNST
jgi:uncharacterized membrane protein